MKFLILIFLLFPSLTYGTIIINEVAWMGTEASYNSEWIELYNAHDKDMLLDGWVLKSADEGIEVELKGFIPAKGFFLLERGNDGTLPGIQADVIYKGTLNNSGEHLQLYSQSKNLIDDLNFTKWPAGDNKTKQTMERVGDEWLTSENPGGTPQSKNQESVAVGVGLPDPQQEKDEDGPPQKESIEAEPLRIYPGGVVFTEIMPSPEGSDSENEWIKISNQNNFEVDLSDWTIKDTLGSIKEYLLKETIPALESLILKRPDTGITLNNDGDGLILLNPDKKIVDSVNFGKASTGQSYIKTNSEWQWSEANEKIVPVRTPQQSQISQSPQQPQQSQAKLFEEPLEKQRGLASLFLTGVFVALASTTVFFAIKHNMDKTNYLG